MAAGSDTAVVSLPMTAADTVHGSLTTYIDFDSPMGTNFYEPVGVQREVEASKPDERPVWTEPTP